MQEFFHMGGYAFYVWSSYGLAVVVLAANIFSSRGCEKQTLRAIEQRLKRQARKA